MKAQLIAALVQALLIVFSEERMKGFVDKLLDYVEDMVVVSQNELDNAIILPICGAIRKAFDIPDNDEEIAV